MRYRSVIVTLTSDKVLTVRVRFGPSGLYTTLIDGFNLAAAAEQAPVPATFKLGFVAGTGRSTNYYEIRNVKINRPADLAVSATDGQTSTTPGQPTIHTVTVTNTAPRNAAGGAFSATLSPAVTGVTWTCSASAGAVCPAPSGDGNSLATTGLNLAAGQTLTYTFRGVVASDPPSGIWLRAQVQIHANMRDTDPGNDEVIDTTSLPPSIAEPTAIIFDHHVSAMRGFNRWGRLIIE